MNIPELYKIFLQNPVISTDTRKITPNCLFFALKGENFDANNFASQAIEQGAAYAIVDNTSLEKNPKLIFVNDVLQTLQELANYHRKTLNIPVIGLTGTNGKTTTKELINAVLSQKFKTTATQGNLNNHIGVPLTLLSVPQEAEIAIVEIGANHQKEIEFLCSIAEPDFGLITNVGKAHLEGFGSFEGVKKGKGELYDYLEKTNGTVFVNDDNPHLKEMADTRTFKEVIYYGSSALGYISGKLTENDPYLAVEWKDNQGSYEVQSQLTGIYNFENILAAVAIGKKFGLSTDEINKGISDYVPKNNRSQIIKTANNTVIGDFYNANPSSMAVAIENIAKLKADKKVLILGDMFELGEESAKEHEHIINKALSYLFSEVIFVGNAFYQFKDSYEVSFYKSTDELKTAIGKNIIKDALVLLKGSRGMKLEQVLDYL